MTQDSSGSNSSWLQALTPAGTPNRAKRRTHQRAGWSGGRRGWRRRTMLDAFLAAFAVGLVIATAFTLIQLRADPTSTPGAGAEVAGQNRPATDDGTADSALFIGDDYLTNGPVTESFAGRISQKMGWVLLTDAQQGTGFVADGSAYSSTNSPYYTRLADDAVRYRPDYVVITGGRNDGQVSSSTATAAVEKYLRAVRKAFPDARVVVVAPFWVDSRPPSTLTAIAAQERLTAREIHAAFIDPLSGQWITNSTQRRYIQPNRVLPNADGSAYLADQFIRAFRKLPWSTAKG